MNQYTRDCIEPAPENAIPIYDNLSSGCKYYVEFVNGSHCAFSDNNPSICNIGQTLGCLGQTFIDTAYQRNLTLQLVQPWLDAQLKDATAAFTTFLANLSQQVSDAAVTTTSSCP